MAPSSAIPFDKDLAKHVTGKVSGYVLNRNAFAGQQRPGPGMFFTSVGGLTPERYCAESRVKKHARVQIRLVGDRKRFEDGQATMRDVWDATDEASITGYFDILTVESEANYLGEDMDGHPVWTLNVDMWHEVTLGS